MRKIIKKASSKTLKVIGVTIGAALIIATTVTGYKFFKKEDRYKRLGGDV